MNTIDPFFKQKLSYKHNKINLEFKVSQDLFSSTIIDHGTQRLLRTLLFEKIDSFKKALDLGCGYGPIGIALQASCPSAEVHMVDRDALAIEFSKENSRLNGFDNIKTYGSLGYNNIVDTDFDLIVSNIPAKVGETILRKIILDAQNYLIDGGKVVIVVIDAIADFIDQELTADENIEVTFHRSWPGHHVYHYQFKTKRTVSTQNSFNAGDFYQQTDSLLLTYISSLNLKPKPNILCINPEQGYIPLAVAQQIKNCSLFIPDRDLLALKTTSHNLEKHHVTHQISHQVGYLTQENIFDAAVGVLPEKQNLEVYKMYLEQIATQMKNGSPLLLSSSSTVITRVEDLIDKNKMFDIIRRDRKKRRSVIEIKIKH